MKSHFASDFPEPLRNLTISSLLKIHEFYIRLHLESKDSLSDEEFKSLDGLLMEAFRESLGPRESFLKGRDLGAEGRSLLETVDTVLRNLSEDLRRTRVRLTEYEPRVAFTPCMLTYKRIQRAFVEYFSNGKHRLRLIAASRETSPALLRTGDADLIVIGRPVRMNFGCKGEPPIELLEPEPTDVEFATLGVELVAEHYGVLFNYKHGAGRSICVDELRTNHAGRMVRHSRGQLYRRELKWFGGEDAVDGLSVASVDSMSHGVEFVRDFGAGSAGKATAASQAWVIVPRVVVTSNWGANGKCSGECGLYYAKLKLTDDQDVFQSGCYYRADDVIAALNHSTPAPLAALLDLVRDSEMSLPDQQREVEQLRRKLSRLSDA